MAGKLVTIATFDQAGQAHVAKNALEVAGIQAVITDEETAAMLWSVSTAIGGIKVKVLEEDAERAVRLLEQELGPDGAEANPDEFAAEAEAASPEDGVEPPAGGAAPHPQPFGTGAPPTNENEPSERDDYARRVFFAAWLGLAFPPLSIISLYFLFKAAFGLGQLSPRGRYNALVGGAVTAGGVLLGITYCCGFAGAFR